MTPKYTLRWLSTNARHTRFTVFDHTGANCGDITVLTVDAKEFVDNNWDGAVDWGNAPSIELFNKA
jgi:hypothetical protein